MGFAPGSLYACTLAGGPQFIGYKRFYELDTWFW